MSGSDSDTIVAPPVGTGLGTNALPFAQNVQIVGNSFTPTITWSLPPGVSDGSVNDGNVDRWRIRVNDRNATASFDQRLFTSPGNIPLDTTSFPIPAGVITANGKYRVTVLLEGLTPFTRSRVRTDLILGPAALSRPFVFRQHEDRTLAGGGIEDNLVFGADLVDTNDVLIQGANVTATNPGTAGSITLEACSGPGARFPFKCYSADVPYTAAIASNSWQIQATGQGLNGVLPKFGTGPGTGPLPFAQNVKVSENSLTPTVTWTLPPALVNHLNGIQLLNDGNVNFWRVRVSPLNPDGTLGDRVFDTENSDPQNPHRRLELNATSFRVPAGFITEPGRYVASVMLEGWFPYNRSRVYVTFDAVPDAFPGEIITIITNILLDEDS